MVSDEVVDDRQGVVGLRASSPTIPQIEEQEHHAADDARHRDAGERVAKVLHLDQFYQSQPVCGPLLGSSELEVIESQGRSRGAASCVWSASWS